MSDKLEQKIMDQIKSGRVKLKSRYIFVAKKLGLRGGLALSVLLAILFFNLVFFYMKATDNLGYLSFGSRGAWAFLESFPYLLVVSLIVLLFVAGYLLTKSELAHKRPFVYLAIGLVVLIMIVGGAMAHTGVSEGIERHVFEGRGPGIIFKPFLHRAMRERGHGMTGKLIEIREDYLVLQTPCCLQKIDINHATTWEKEGLEVGCFIMAVGERQGDVFVARGIRRAGEGAMPMMRRGVGRRFGLPGLMDNGMMQLLPSEQMEKIQGCMQECRMNGNVGMECMERCR